MSNLQKLSHRTGEGENYGRGSQCMLCYGNNIERLQIAKNYFLKKCFNISR
jgi:hypothetical protein